MKPRTSALSVSDFFCGAGGSSWAVKQAGGEVVIATNHWDLALETHNSNFPDTLHVKTDISTSNPRQFPATDVAWFSPSCTNHSLAKGVKRKNQGQLSLFGDVEDPAAERSRATMWDVVRFSEILNYNALVVENVVDARRWVLWDAWLTAMHALNYDHKCVYYNSMFAPPTPQSRDRMYVVFWKRHNLVPDLEFTPPAYCPHCECNIEARQVWKNPNKAWGKYGMRNQYLYVCPTCRRTVTPYYYAAANAIDWSLGGERIGSRKRPLKPKTLARVRYGLEKFASAFTMRYDGTHQRDMTEELITQTGREVGAIVMPFVVETAYSHAPDARAYSLEAALNTQSARQSLGLVIPPFLIAPNDRSMRSRSVDDAMPTLLPNRPGALVIPPGAMLINSAGSLTPRPLSDPLPTQVGSRSPFLIRYYGQSDGAYSVAEAFGTQLSNPHDALIETNGTPEVEDCYFRMLAVHEVQASMAFPDDYVIVGTKRECIQQLGNAITPPVGEMILRRVFATFA